MPPLRHGIVGDGAASRRMAGCDGHAAVGRRTDGPTMMVHIGMMRAIRLRRPKPKPAPRKKRAKAYRVMR